MLTLNTPVVYNGDPICVAIDPADNLAIEIRSGAAGIITNAHDDGTFEVAFSIAPCVRILGHRLDSSTLRHVVQ